MTETRSPEPVPYEHTQPGYVARAFMGTGLGVSLYFLIAQGFNWPAFVVAVVLGACLVLFWSLTVKVTAREVVLAFGPGIIRKRFPLSEIESVKVVRNRWYYGWGVRLTPHGWLHNVSGLDAVELELRSDKKVRIGTDDPQGLADAIRQALRPCSGQRRG